MSARASGAAGGRGTGWSGIDPPLLLLPAPRFQGESRVGMWVFLAVRSSLRTPEVGESVKRGEEPALGSRQPVRFSRRPICGLVGSGGVSAPARPTQRCARTPTCPDTHPHVQEAPGPGHRLGSQVCARRGPAVLGVGSRPWPAHLGRSLPPVQLGSARSAEVDGPCGLSCLTHGCGRVKCSNSRPLSFS